MTTPSSPQPGSLVARSALLTLSGAPVDHGLSLQVARNSDHRPIVAPGSVTVTLDGHAVPVTAQPDGTLFVSTRAESAGAHTLGVVVSHDGIRELLTATVTVPQQRSALEELEGHGMFAWWVLNIAVVLIAVIVISRRRG
ncbi:MAG TPA: hypothetical protein VMA54_06465 [Steroidobacteraceae bacterium]|nr:hypothetical protein [Steroidobacteraceae bacterium]